MEGKRRKKRLSEQKVDFKKLFRFQSFSERIANISIDVTHRVRHIPTTPEDHETFFSEGLRKWKELNCTLDFVSFSREIHDKVDSLAQLVHHKEEIVAKLKHYLSIKDSLAYEPLLNLLVQLARDLQSQFYPHFKDFFPVLIARCDTLDTDVIQCVFTNLAYLLKFLWRHMLKDLQNVFSLYSGLLDTSQRPHIRRFAVESFGFLLRKVHDQQWLVDVICHFLSEQHELSEGIGQLLFEICKGVAYQFHSCTESLFRLLLWKLGTHEYSSDTMFQAVTKMVEMMAEFCRKESAGPVWRPLLAHLKALSERWRECEDESTAGALSHTLHLVGIMVSWRKGSRINCGPEVIQALHDLNFELSLPREVFLVGAHVAASLILVCPVIPDCQPLLTKLVRGVCSHQRVDKESVQVVTQFFQELVEKWDMFESEFLPECLQYCEAALEQDSNQCLILMFLSQLCLHSNHSNGQLSTFKFELIVDCSRSKVVTMLTKHVEECIQSLKNGAEIGDERVATLWSTLVCLQYIRCPERDVVDLLRELYSFLCKTSSQREQEDGVVFLLAQCVLALVRNQDDEITVDEILTLTKMHPTSLAVLNSVHLALRELCCSEAKKRLNSKHLVEFLPVLQPNLSSPSSAIRLATLNILCRFQQLPIILSVDSDDTPLVDVLDTCLKAEEIAASLDTYRDKLLWLEKLKYSSHMSTMLPDEYKEFPIRYLISMLYVNFSLLWEPVCELISSYTVKENMKTFWNVFGQFLDSAQTIAENPVPVSPPATHSDTNWYNSIPVLFDHWKQHVTSMGMGQPDHANFRLLLWKCVSIVSPGVVEPRSRLLAPLLLRFIKNEYSLREDNLMESQNLCASVDDGLTDAEPMEEVTKEEEKSTPPDDKAQKQKKSSTFKTTRRLLTRTLSAMLVVFTRFTNPKSLYKQDELAQLYLKLLTHKDSEVQKLALACMMTYKPPHLLPYRENLECLLDDDMFREELSRFCVDSSCSVVSEDHREAMMPVLVRILYGRMLRQGGHNTGKSGGASRRGIVLRFLAGCQGDEMKEFIKLLTLPFQDKSGHDDIIDPHHVTPLKKQQGFLNMFGQMISILGTKVESYLPMLFSILLKQGRVCAQLLERRSKILPQFVTALKALRQLVINRATECFDSFILFDFTPYDEEIFASLVWPQLPRLPQECIQAPTPLMKLIAVWTKHKRYLPYFGRVIPESVILTSASQCSEEQHILHYVYSCLFSTQVSEKVCSCILEMTINLFNLTEEEGYLEVADNELESSLVLKVTELLQPHFPKLLNYLHIAIKGEGKQSGRNGGLQLEFSVLSKISNFVKGSSESAHLIELLLPFLVHPSERFKENEENVLQTIQNLMPAVQRESRFYRSLSQLFGVLKNRNSRSLLCDIFQELANKDKQLQRTADIVTKLNQWDRKYIEEPAYETRLEGFAEAKDMFPTLQDEGQWTPDLLNSLLPVLHNALYTLSQCDDMSLRDAAASFLSDLIGHIQVQHTETFQLFILSATVKAVRQGLRSKQEYARHEFISVLSQLVRQYSTHPKFGDLMSLCHNEPEADFFENVRHIQLHRRTRAFRKLATVCKEGSLSQTSMMDFLLPLANQVVYTPATNVAQNLISEAVNVISAVSAQLNWSNYYSLLSSYLRQLPRKKEVQRALVKVVVGILDNFHFDLSLVDASGCGSEDSDVIEKMDEDVPTNQVKETKETEALQSPVSEEGGVESMSCNNPMSVETASCDQSGDEQRKKRLAEKINRAILHSILPGLQSVLTKRIDVPGHKLSRQDEDRDSEILRVPVAMAMTKLLLALPENVLHTHLPNLLLKVCSTLKNRSHDVRDVARDALTKMACALGPKYLYYIIKELKDTLTRGYMLHVLGYSLHSLLRGVTSFSSGESNNSSPDQLLRCGGLDSCLELISPILIDDLFGGPAEERDSGENVARIPESKSPQSYNCFEIVAQYISPHRLPDFLLPLKQVLEDRCIARVTRVVEEVFRRVGLGVLSNEGFSPPALLMFIHGLVQDSIPQLATKPAPKQKMSSSLSISRPIDSRLLPPTPVRGGPKPLIKWNFGANVITEFGLQIFHIALRRGRFDVTSDEQLGMLDPFVPLLSESLSSHHVKVLTRALQCLVWIVRMPLPSLANHVNTISSHLFLLLRRYARAGSSVSSNRELVLSAFKAMTVILRDFRKHDISEDELKLLLTFVEEDIYDSQRQSSAFPLLKAILGRKLVTSEIYELMHKVCELSVKSDSEYIRQQCRQVVVQFLMDYPLGKKLNRYLDFYTVNLSYGEQSGRESVIEQLASIFTKFPDRLLNRHATYFLLPLSSQLVNDESPVCRQMVAETIKTLLKRLDTTRTNDVIAIIDSWSSSANLLHKRLGIQLIGLMVEVEGQGFEKRVATILPKLNETFDLYDPTAEEDTDNTDETIQTEEDKHPSKKTKGTESAADEEQMDEDDNRPYPLATTKMVDHLLFTALSTFRKICSECSVLRATTHADHMTQLWEKVNTLLLHPHTWVRLLSCQLFGLLFAAYTPDELMTSSLHKDDKVKKKDKGKRRSLKTKPVPEEYLLQDTITKVQDLSHSFCMQLSSPLLTPELANQSVKNLVFLSKVLHQLHLSEEVPFSAVTDEMSGGVTSDQVTAAARGEEGGSDRTRDLYWLIDRMSRLAKYEAAHHPKEKMKRTCVLQWSAAVSMDLGKDHLPPYLPRLLRPVYRELVDVNKTSGDDLQSLAQESVELIKSVCGRETFAQAYAHVHKEVGVARERRRKQAALEAVADPEKAIRRKHKKNELKKESKKRKILQLRPDGTSAAATSRKKFKTSSANF